MYSSTIGLFYWNDIEGKCVIDLVMVGFCSTMNMLKKRNNLETRFSRTIWIFSVMEAKWIIFQGIVLITNFQNQYLFFNGRKFIWWHSSYVCLSESFSPHANYEHTTIYVLWFPVSTKAATDCTYGEEKGLNIGLPHHLDGEIIWIEEVGKLPDRLLQ